MTHVNRKNPLSARSRAPLNTDTAIWWEIYGKNHEYDSYKQLRRTKSNPALRSNNINVLDEHLVRPSDVKRELKLARLRAICLAIENSAQNMTKSSPSLIDTTDKLLETNKEINNSNEYKSLNFDNLRDTTNLKKIYRNNKDIEVKTDYSTMEIVDTISEEHTLKPSVVRLQTKLDKYIGRGSEEELSSILERYRRASDTRLACSHAIIPSHEIFSCNTIKTLSNSCTLDIDRESCFQDNRSNYIDITNMPRLPSGRDSLTTPRSSRSQIPSSSAHVPLTHGLRRPPVSTHSTLPRVRKKYEKMPSPPSSPSLDSPVTGSELRRQNEELRSRLAQETADHKRRLEAYKRSQQGQAALVSRLQAKVLQYKQRCSDLEHDTTADSYRAKTSRASVNLTPSNVIALPAPKQTTIEQTIRRDERIDDVDTALRRLEEEKQKCEKLLKENTRIREQLEESQEINEALTNDLQKLTNDWEALREEMIIKEDEWKDEEQAFNDFYTNEHNRLLSLWREVVTVKRYFNELQSTTEREMLKVRSDMDTTTRELVGTLTTYTMNAQANTLKESKAEESQEKPLLEIHNELREVSAQRDKVLLELKERDGRIQRLLGELQCLEEKCNSLETSSEEASVLRSALEEVARALIADSESHSIGSASVDRSPRRARPNMQTSTVFAESTISAVQAALHKYQLNIHELQVKLQNAREQVSMYKKHCETVDANNNNLEHKVDDLQGKLDQVTMDINQIVQEKESMQKTIETLRNEKLSLEQNRISINSMVESLTSDYEKLQKTNAKLDKLIETLESEKRDLQCDLQNVQQDLLNRETQLRTEEDKSSRLRSELISMREDLNKAHLANELLEQQKTESESLISQMEQQRADLEIDLDRSFIERSDLRDTLEKLESNIEILRSEKKKLHDRVMQLENEKSMISNQNTDHMSDMASLKKELLSAEQIRLQLESEKAALQEKIKSLECDKEKVELELSQVKRERNDLSSQISGLTRKNDNFNEEIMRLQQRFEQLNETNGRLNRTLEEYVKDTEEKQIQINTIEKEKQHLQEQLASILTEKDSLEAVLFDTNNLLEASETKGAQLEKQLNDSLLIQEGLKGQILRLTKDLENNEKKNREFKNSLTQQSSKKEMEYQQILNNLIKTSADNIKKLNDEKEQTRLTLEQKLNSTIAALTAEKEAIESSAKEREKKMRAARDAFAAQHDEAILRAENDKQQSLLIAQQDMQALMDRLNETKRLLDNEKSNLDRVKRECQIKMDQDRITINQLKDELIVMKTKLDEAKTCAEDECSRYENRIKELQLERENCQKDGQELRTQLQLSEDKCDHINSQLNDTLRKLKEVENERDDTRKELTEVRRQLGACSAERDKLSSACRDLREHVKRSEADRRNTARSLQEAYQKVANLEEVRNSLENERTRIQTILKETESTTDKYQSEALTLDEELKKVKNTGEQMQKDTKELQARLENESAERERLCNEISTVRRQVGELETLLSTARSDLARQHHRANDLEHALRARDQELVLRLEDCRSKERRLEELKHNLEVCLADATQQIQELKARLSGCDSRCRGVESQLAASETGRREAEHKLSTLMRCLRRVCGIQPDGSLQPRARVVSPARRYSPHRGRDHSEERGELLDVDPEQVKKGIRLFMHDVMQLEREKEDYKSQVCVLKKQLKDAADQQGQGQGKLTSVTHTLRAAQDNIGKLQVTLTQKDTQLQAMNETIQNKSVELSSTRDKLHTLETQIATLSEEKGQCEANAEKLRHLLSERDEELAVVREALNSSESRSARLDVRRAQLEGDANRLTVTIREKDSAYIKLKEEFDTYMRTITSLEERCSSLKTTVEQLTASLQKAAQSESELRSDLSKLQRQLSEARQNQQNVTDKLRQCQKNLSNIENDKRIVCEKLESSKISCAEYKRLNASLEDQLHRLNVQLNNLEVQRSDLESRLRLSAYDGKDSVSSDVDRDMHAIQRERDEYKTRLETMQETLRKLESERLIIQKSSLRSKSHDRTVHYPDLDAGPESCKELSRIRDICSKDSSIISAEVGLLEIENRELRMRIRRLEKELMDKEAEISHLRTRLLSDVENLSSRETSLHTQRLIEAREANHRQQIRALETQLAQLRGQLAAEIRRRQSYVARSGRAARDVQRLRNALGDSLRTVSQEPELDSYLLEHEARKLDSTLSHSLPPLNDSFDSNK